MSFIGMEELRSTLVKCIVAIARVLFYWIPGGDNAYGIALSAFHPVLIISWVLIFFLYPYNRPLRIFICSTACLTLLSHLYFRSCLITRAEQILTGSKDTVVDPVLHFLNIKPSNETRLAITVGGSITVASIMLFSICMDIIS